MADVTFASEGFITFAKPYLRDCRNDLIAHHLKLAAREFLRRTGLWDVAITPINVVGSTAVYAVPAPVANTEIVEFLEVRYSTRRIWPLDRDEANARYGDDWENTTSAEPNEYVLDDESTIRLVPKPTTSLAAG